MTSSVEFLRSLPARGALVVLAGAVCSGKSTFARLHSLPGDRVLDWDVLFAEVTGLPMHDQPPEFAREVYRQFERELRVFRQGYVIRSAPKPDQRELLRRKLHARSIVLAVPAAVCLERLGASDRPMAAKVRGAGFIATWWAQYVPDYDERETTLRSFALDGVLA